MSVRWRYPKRGILSRRAAGTCGEAVAATVRLPVHRIRRRLHRRLAANPDPRGGRRSECRGYAGAAAVGAIAQAALLHQLPDPADWSVLDRYLGGDRSLPAQPADQLDGVRAAVPADRIDTPRVS